MVFGRRCLTIGLNRLFVLRYLADRYTENLKQKWKRRLMTAKLILIVEKRGIEPMHTVLLHFHIKITYALTKPSLPWPGNAFEHDVMRI